MESSINKPLFSLISVVYNSSPALKKTIQSISFRTFRDFEYIIIDGASTDNISSLIDEYKNMIAVFVSEPDNGLYDAMNKGIRLARGQYLWFINAGNELAGPGILEKLSITARTWPHAIYGETIIIDKDDRELGP